MFVAARMGLGRFEFRPKRLIVVSALAVAAGMPGLLGEVTRRMLMDAYLQVSVFVAATFLIFYGCERLFKIDLRTYLARDNLFSVPLAAAMGATPGCGGAVMVVVAYSSGNIGFGAVIAALTATMGDAAFLLIAVRPDAAAVILPTTFFVGILSGWFCNLLLPNVRLGINRKPNQQATPIGKIRLLDVAYLAAAIPGLALGILILFQIEVGAAIAWLPNLIAYVGTSIGLVIWSTSNCCLMSHPSDRPVTRMAEETSFISIYVIGALLVYEYLTLFLGFNLESLFHTFSPLLPLVAVIIGFIPGCGPQILVTSLFISGMVPFSALVGNAISNDGDALIPAIAVNWKVAVLATLVSAVPALLVAYGFYFLVPDFMI